MAGTEIIMGKNALFTVGTKVVACATDFKLSLKPKMLNTTCQGSGNFETNKPGMKAITWSCSGLVKQFTTLEETDNISPNDWIDAILNDTELTIHFEGINTGDRVHTIVGYMDNYDETQKINDLGTYNASGVGNSYTRTGKPA